MKEFKTAKGTILPLLDLRGKYYLQVAHRLVWFREEKPDYGIETEAIFLDDNKATVKAYIKRPDGSTWAVGHQTETKQGFPDYLAKAETSAIGRALAMCGYGTQFAPELEEGERLADAPVEKKAVMGYMAASSDCLSLINQNTSVPATAGFECEACGALLVKNKKNDFSCKNWKDGKKHSYLTADEMKRYLETTSNEIPF